MPVAPNKLWNKVIWTLSIGFGTALVEVKHWNQSTNRSNLCGRKEVFGVFGEKEKTTEWKGLPRNSSHRSWIFFWRLTDADAKCRVVSHLCERKHVSNSSPKPTNVTWWLKNDTSTMANTSMKKPSPPDDEVESTLTTMQCEAVTVLTIISKRKRGIEVDKMRNR